MRYMLLFFADEKAWTALTEEEQVAAIARIGAWVGEQASAGRMVEGGRLQGRQSAKTVRLGPAGRSEKPFVTDGPFAETKEALGSYAVITAPDLAAAVAIAATWPAGGAVEVRLVMDE